MMPAAKMSKEQLKEKLDALQCHFTWNLGVNSNNPQHHLQRLDVDIRHMAHQNRVALLGVQAYLHQLNNQSKEALQSLQAAEEHNREEEQPASTAGSLIIYGNYAWIHYLQDSYQEAETCLERVQQLCPTLLDVQLIPHIQALKGWSLVVIRARNGERARECFELALMFEPENRSLRAGLGMALYSSWKYSWQLDSASEAISYLERIVDEQPNNYRAKIYLAGLLGHVDKEKAIGLIRECVEESSDPEVLKQSVMLWIPWSTQQAVEIAQRALQQDPGYHLLYQALAKSYKQHWIQAKQKDKGTILDAAISHLQQIVQNHPDLEIIPVKLQLAAFVGERDPAEEEEILRELEQTDTLSPRHRQALNRSWGMHFLYRRRSQDMAKAKFMDAYSIAEQTDERRDCGRRLRKMAQVYRDKGNANAAKAIYSFLHEADQHLPGYCAVLTLDDGDHSYPTE
ncbi:interferon-induced protein with tetratricopeptide repeats 1-like [Chamaea fasciata]|uniref:interferon-induced protein with tetratricopeptide repeats 1-like n=1 Tax=Chamaea fasciata TaxID=190680 RepID=UPI003369D986